MSNKTMFSTLFSLLFSCSEEGGKEVFFRSLVGWIDYEPMSQSISYWTTGTRKVSKEVVLYFRESDSIEKTYEYLKKEMIGNIKNCELLVGKLVEFIDNHDFSDTTKTYLKELTTTDLTLCIACLLYLSIVVTDHLPNTSDLKASSANKYLSEAERNNLSNIIWYTSQQNYFISHEEGNRFAKLNIIEGLLPKGYIEPLVVNFHFDSNNPKLNKISDIYKSTKDHISITGEGGIGKTTFLQKLLEKNYGSIKEPRSYSSKEIVPIFIELNRCPKEIGNWYVDRYNKTNFITRYIADSIQSTEFEYRDYNLLLEEIEADFRKVQSRGRKTYLLLLDGFNEVSTDIGANNCSIRALLSHEISELSKLPNVRIITTSRVTQSAYYAADFTRVHLNGLEESDIKRHLRKSGFSNPVIGQIVSNKRLMKCLSVPLFLCMFSAKKEYDEHMPETQGEILFNFFHKNGEFYNLRQRANETYNNPFKDMPYVFEALLDYIVPYVGWYYMHNDTFSLSKLELYECVKKALLALKDVLKQIDYIPLKDFNLDIRNVNSAIITLEKLYKKDTDVIISCIQDYLGIMYRYDTQNALQVDTYRYSFIHHYFRDYFSAIWNINMLRMIPYLKKPQSITDIHESVLNNYWNINEAETIGQILQEHRNTPRLNVKTGNWEIPYPKTDDQLLLIKILDSIRNKLPNSSVLSILIQNIIMVFRVCRGELTGVCFDDLDISKCNFHAIACSRKGLTQTLSASFCNAVISESSLMPIEHLDSVTEFIYADNRCITVDSYKCIKIWDVLSGALIDQYDCSDDNEFADFSSEGFIRISPDRKWMAVKILPANEDREGACIRLIPFEDCSDVKIFLRPERLHKDINDFVFTADSKRLLVVFDGIDMYSYELCSAEDKKESKFAHLTLDNMCSGVRIYPSKEVNDFYIVSADYDPFEATYTHIGFSPKNKRVEIVECEEDNQELLTACRIFKGSLSSNKIMEIGNFFTFINTTPVIEYIPDIDCFLLFDSKNFSINLFDCKLGMIKCDLQTIIDDNEAMPDAIHYSQDNNSTCYVMYPDVCYQVKINKTRPSIIIEKYDVPVLESSNSDFESYELSFVVNTAPTNNRFLLWNEDHDTYEWHIESGEIQYKYNTIVYDTVALIPDDKRNLFILVHSENGISIFSQDSLKIYNSICFPESDYKIVASVYSEVSGYMFILFVRGQHNFIRRLNIKTSEYQTIYSKSRPWDDTIRLSLSDNGLDLLITDVQNCYEYSSLSDSVNAVYTAGNNEWLTTAYYVNEEIHLGIAMAREYLKPVFNPRCEVYKKVNDAYTPIYAYEIPELPEELLAEFMHEKYQTGTPCNLNVDYIQNYWVTKGFFKELTPEISKFLSLKKMIKKDGVWIKSGKVKYDICKPLQVMNKHAIDTIRSDHLNCNSYSYLSHDYSNVISIYDFEQLISWTDLKNEPRDYKLYDYNKTIKTPRIGTVSWEHAIPIKGNRFICCMDTYHLYPVDAITGEVGSEIKYTPGLAICGCNFSSLFFGLESAGLSEVEEIILENGGNIIDKTVLE